MVIVSFCIDDGTIKVWRDVLRTDTPPKIVASWAVIPESLGSGSREKGGYEVYTEWLDETRLVNTYLYATTTTNSKKKKKDRAY